MQMPRTGYFLCPEAPRKAPSSGANSIMDTILYIYILMSLRNPAVVVSEKIKAA